MNVESHIGQYKILQTLGTGGMGTVYLGEHILLGRRAAIKTLLPSLSSHREIVDRFFNEARAISAISDPGVVQIFDFGYHVDGTAYIVMEYLEGESLHQRLERLTKLPLVEALRITRQIAVSLAAAHQRGIIHRDLKPGNVFLTRDTEAQGGERTKILDFGIAKLVSTPADLVATQTGTMLGTPVYMSPEQCRGSGKIDHRSDIYSVGCALFHMLTGVPPFDCDSVGDFIASHLKEDPPAPSELARELPAEVDTLVLRCLAKEPADRYQSMNEVASACEAALAHLSDPGIQPAAAAIPLTKEMRIQPRPVSDKWFVNSQVPVVASELDDDDDIAGESTRSGYQKIALIAALVLGLAAGLVGTSYMLSEGETIAMPPVAAASTAEPADTHASSTTREDAPPPLPAVEVAEEQAPAPVVEETQKPDRPHPPRSQARPRPRRHVPAPQQAPTESEDDLYETR